MKGFFQLVTAADLRSKLRYEYERLQKEPNPYQAFNFFVTAEHLLDWRYPGDARKPARTAARQGELLLQITSHLANGAKHFEIEAQHHDSVAGTGRVGGHFGARSFRANYFAALRTGGFLAVRLDGAAAATYGEWITVLDLAKKVLDYWDSQSLP